MAWAFLCFDWAMSHIQTPESSPDLLQQNSGVRISGPCRWKERPGRLIQCWFDVRVGVPPADYIAEELAEKTRRQHSRSVPKLVTWRNVMWVEFVLWNWEEVPRECWSWTGQTQRRLVLIRYLCRIIETYCHAGLPSWPLVGWGRDARETAVWTVFSRVGIPGSRRKARLGAQQRNELRLVGCRHS